MAFRNARRGPLRRGLPYTKKGISWMGQDEKPLAWRSREKPRTPPVGAEARQKMGALLGLLQRGETLGPPHSRPLHGAGRRVRELRVRDGETGLTWRLAYRVDADAIVVLHWWAKKTEKTAQRDVELCRQRAREYDRAGREGG